MNESARSMPANRSAQLGQQQRRQAVGAIDVEPRIDLVGDIGAAVEIVDHTCVGRTAGGHDDADIVAVADRGAQRLAGQPAVGTGRHDQRLETEQVQRVVDRGMRGVGDGHDPAIAGALAPDGQCRQVADRSAAHEAARRRRRHAGRSAQQIDHLVLGGDRAGALQPRLGREAGRADTIVSIHTDATDGDSGMKARNRSLSRPMLFGATTSVEQLPRVDRARARRR